jgi:hypothetical protein
MALARCLTVDAFAHGDGRELFVRSLFLVKDGIEEAHDVIVPERVRPRDQRAVAGDLIVLDRLRRPDDSRVKNFLVGDFAGGFIAFLDQPVDGRTFLRTSTSRLSLAATDSTA